MANEMVYTTVIDELLNTITIPELKPLYTENADMWLDDYLPCGLWFVGRSNNGRLFQNDWQSPVLIGFLVL